MAQEKERTTPFYGVLLMVGVLFFVTASTYFVMTLRADRQGRYSQNPSQANTLMQFMDQRGGQVLVGEVLLLGVCAVAAMMFDRSGTGRRI